MKWHKCSRQLPLPWQKVWIHAPDYSNYQDKFLAALCDKKNCPQWHVFDDDHVTEIVDNAVTMWAEIEPRI